VPAAILVPLAAVGTVWVISAQSAHERALPPPRHSATGPVPSSAAATVSAIATWASANLPSSARVITDADTADAVRADGFSGGVTTTGASCRDGTFLLVTAAVRARARTDRALTQCLASALPVASFAGGTDVSEIRHVVADHARSNQARRTARADQRRGGAALAANSAITMSAQARRSLLAGGLDLRAQTVLVELAGQERLVLDAVVADPAEARAGLAARVVDLAPADPRRTDALLAGLSAGYRPRVVQLSSGAWQLTWPFRAEPLTVLK
jgi:hypothetical protein